MRFGYGTLSLGVAIMMLLLVSPAYAHELTEKQAKKALNPIAAELIPTVSPLIAQKLPGATVTKSRVAACEIKKSHRADCAIVFSVQGASTGETECGMDGRVQFKSKRSRKLKISTGGGLVCFFSVPLS
jgi:hypothetical protein